MRETLQAHVQFSAINDNAIAFYRQRDLKGLMDYLTSAVPLSAVAQSLEAKGNDCLITARNRVMAERLDRMLGHELLFVAVGAFHLVGESGVLRLLEDKGYQVMPVAQHSFAE